MNILGKLLVFLNTGLSVVFLILALGIYTHQVDWGWKEPRKELGERIPSEIDKRTAVVKMVGKTKREAVARVEIAQQNLYMARYKWPLAHIWMQKELEKLDSVPSNIAQKHVSPQWPIVYTENPDETTIRQVEIQSGKILQLEKTFPFISFTKTKVVDGKEQYVTVTRKGKLGIPVLSKPVQYTFYKNKDTPVTINIDKSYNTYQEELANVKVEEIEAKEEIDNVIFEQKQIAVKLNGGEVMFPTWWMAMQGDRHPFARLSTAPEMLTYGAYQPIQAPDVPGLYELALEREKKIQDKLRREIEHIRPQWVKILINSQLQLQRYESLKVRRDELQAKLNELKVSLGEEKK